MHWIAGIIVTLLGIIAKDYHKVSYVGKEFV
jgi:hypothetical protein